MSMLRGSRSIAVCTLVIACFASACDGGAGADGGLPDGGRPEDASSPPDLHDVRVADRAVVDWMAASVTEPWWIEERLAPWPRVAGDRDPGPRRIVRVAGEPVVVWEPDASERLTDAVLHPSGEWSAVGVGADRRPFLVRGDRDGLLARIVLDDPELATDTHAWYGATPPLALAVGALSEDSVRVAADGEDVVVALMNEHNAVLSYRWRWDGTWRRGARTLVTPAAPLTPFLPMGGSYDDFDAMVDWFLVFLATDHDGNAYVAHWVNAGRLRGHNQAFGTDHAILVDGSAPGARPSDVLVSRVERDGTRAWSRVVGTVNLDDEPYGIAVGDRVAVIGRHRRELDLDNTEWHLHVSVLDTSGALLEAHSHDVLDSGIAESAVWTPDGSLFIGGSEAWRQNPEGFSLFDEGQPFLLRLKNGAIEDWSSSLPATSGHSELRALATDGAHVFWAGLERGPLTHTGDADPSHIRADGFAGYGAIDR